MEPIAVYHSIRTNCLGVIWSCLGIGEVLLTPLFNSNIGHNLGKFKTQNFMEQIRKSAAGSCTCSTLQHPIYN